jgi:hypothetical protein
VQKVKKMKKYILKPLIILLVMFAFCVSSFSVKAQDESFKMIILDAKANGNNISDWYLERGQFLKMYSNGEGQVSFANASPSNNEQSYGEIFGFESEDTPETDSTYQGKDLYFSWKYKNTYNNDEGTAKVKIVLVFKPQGVVFHCNMMLENLDIYEYTGYLEGTLDTSKIDK